MPKYDEFDLDVQTTKVGNAVTINSNTYEMCATSVDVACPTDDCYTNACYTYDNSCDTNCNIASYDICW